jgi:hypothetical protein
MTAIDLGRVRALIERVHDLPPAERAAVLARECGSDASLRAEVEDLLRAGEEDPAFLSAPSASRVAGLLPDSAPVLPEGTRGGGFR